MVHSICDSYPKFGAAAPRQTGVITRRKKWGRLTSPPPSKCRVKCELPSYRWPSWDGSGSTRSHVLPPPCQCSPLPLQSGAWERLCWLHDVHWPSIQPRSTQSNQSDLNLKNWGSRNIGSTLSAGSARTMPVTFWQYEGKLSPAGTRMVYLWWSSLSIVFILTSRPCMYASERPFLRARKREGHHVPPHQEPLLKHHPRGVFAPHDRWNFLDAVQKAYAIPPVVVLVRGERFPSLKIQVLPMTFHFSEFSRCCSISTRFLFISSV